MSNDNRLREILNQIAPPPEDPEHGMERARSKLRKAYPTEKAPRRLGRPSLAWATAAVVALVVVATLVVPGSSPEVVASLQQIARATREVTFEELPAGSYVYSRIQMTARSEFQATEDQPPLPYFLVETIHSWDRGDVAREVVTADAPRFIDPEHERIYYASGHDRSDGIGETRVHNFDGVSNRADPTTWSHDLGELREQVADYLATTSSPLARDVRTLQKVEELLDPRHNPAPGLRAALVELAGTLPVAAVEHGDGTVLVSLDYEEPAVGLQRYELMLDGAGYLRLSRTTLLEPVPDSRIPAGTVTSEIDWSRPHVVAGPDVFPAEP